MNYVEWCVTVLQALWLQQRNGDQPSIDSAAASLLGNRTFADVAGRAEGEALKQAFSYLGEEGHIERIGRVGDCRVLPMGRIAAEHPHVLWDRAVATTLTSHEELVLRELNRRTHRQGDGFAWIEPTSFADIQAWWRTQPGPAKPATLGEAFQGLGSMHMARTLDKGRVAATFDGVGWQFGSDMAATRPKQVGSQSQAERQRKGGMTVEPIFTGRYAETDLDLCFVLMPLSAEHEGRYRTGFVPAIEQVGLKPRRANDIFDNRAIMEDVWEHICRARVLIADLTGLNPNVCYELGVAHTLGKEVVPVLPEGDKNPFDIGHLRQVRYRDVVGGEHRLVKDLSETLRTILARSNVG